MWKKYLSIIMVPQKSGKIIGTRIRWSWIWLVGFLFISYFILNLFFSFNYIEYAWNKIKLSHLEKQNQVLESRILNLSNLVNNLKSDMQLLMEKERMLRTAFGLPQIDSVHREVGVGGSAELQNLNLGSKADLDRLAKAQVDLGKLLRQSKFENENFNQIYQTILKRKQVLDHTPSIPPVSGYLTRGYGLRIDPFTGARQHHMGVDLAAQMGTPVFATADGVVDFSGWKEGLGNLIILNHLHGYKTYYGHLSKIEVYRGQKIIRGQVIGKVGSTGYSTGPHLHYEVHLQEQALDPLRYIISGPYSLD